MVTQVADKSLEQIELGGGMPCPMSPIGFHPRKRGNLVTIFGAFFNRETEPYLMNEFGMSPQEPAPDALDFSLRELFEEDTSVVDTYGKVLLDRLGNTDAQDLANQLKGLVNIIRAGA